MSRRWEGHLDEGNVSVLTLGWIVLALLALLVMAAASQVHVDRTRLASLADEAALAAVYATGESGYFTGTGGQPGGAPDQAVMSSAVNTWLAEDPRPWVGEVVVLSVTGSADGTATVQLGRTVAPLFQLEALGPFNVGVDLTVEGRSRAG